MDMRLPCVIVFAVLLGLAFAQDSTFDSGVRVAMKIYDDCKKSTGFSPCLKKKAINFMDRLGKMEKLTIIDGINLVRDPQKKQEPVLTEDQLDASLPRALEAKDEALTTMVMDKVTNFLSSRSLDISVPRLIEDEEEDEDYDNYEARDGFGEGGGGGKKKGGGGGGGKKGGKKKGMMGHMMMMMMGKMVALIPIAIAGLFLLAGKALITAKIALLLSGIIALKKLVAAKNSGGGHGHEVHDVHVAHGHGGGGWQSGGGGGWQAGGGGGGGWQSGGGGGGGGWDKRSLNEAQNLAYNAYKQ